MAPPRANTGIVEKDGVRTVLIGAVEAAKLVQP
jgi:hypothetical protein